MVTFSEHDSETFIFHDEHLLRYYLERVSSLDFFSCELSIAQYTDLHKDLRKPGEPHNPKFCTIQYWDTDIIPIDVAQMISQNRDLFPNHLTFNDGNAKKFIDSHFPERIRAAYSRCFHPAMKADYFRLAYLFAHGGIYIDADLVVDAALARLDLATNCIYLSPMVRHREQGADGSWQWCSYEDLIKRQIPRDAVCNFQNDIIAASGMNEVIRIALARATLMTESYHDTSHTGGIHWMTGPSNITFAVWYNVIRSMLKQTRSTEIRLFDKGLYTTTRHLEYKNDRRNWRRASEADL